MPNVFIIEDNKELIRMYERAFRLGGYGVDSVFDGAEGFSRLEKMQEKPDAIILDVMIPTMSGLDVLRHIKQDKNLKNIPVIILTNSFNGENADLFLSLGASQYIIKLETDAKEVVNKVTQVIPKN